MWSHSVCAITGMFRMFRNLKSVKSFTLRCEKEQIPFVLCRHNDHNMTHILEYCPQSCVQNVWKVKNSPND